MPQIGAEQGYLGIAAVRSGWVGVPWHLPGKADQRLVSSLQAASESNAKANQVHSPICRNERNLITQIPATESLNTERSTHFSSTIFLSAIFLSLLSCLRAVQ
jgi:hypothetical protein